MPCMGRYSGTETAALVAPTIAPGRCQHRTVKEGENRFLGPTAARFCLSVCVCLVCLYACVLAYHCPTTYYSRLL